MILFYKNANKYNQSTKVFESIQLTLNLGYCIYSNLPLSYEMLAWEFIQYLNLCDYDPS